MIEGGGSICIKASITSCWRLSVKASGAGGWCLVVRVVVNGLNVWWKQLTVVEVAMFRWLVM